MRSPVTTDCADQGERCCVSCTALVLRWLLRCVYCLNVLLLLLVLLLWWMSYQVYARATFYDPRQLYSSTGQDQRALSLWMSSKTGRLHLISMAREFHPSLLKQRVVTVFFNTQPSTVLSEQWSYRTWSSTKEGWNRAGMEYSKKTFFEPAPASYLPERLKPLLSPSTRSYQAQTYETRLVIPWSYPTLVLSIWPAVVLGLLLHRTLRTRRRRKRGLCLHCGYDLRATPQQCPECGRAAVEPKPAAG